MRENGMVVQSEYRKDEEMDLIKFAFICLVLGVYM